MMCLNNVVRCLLVPLVVALCLVFPACGGTVEPVDSGDVQLPDVVSDDGIDHGGSGDVDSGTDVGSDKINAVFDGPRRAWPGKSVPVSVTIDDPGYFGKMSVDACGSGIQIMVVRGRGSVLLSAPQEPGTCSVVVTQPGFRGSFDLEVSDGDVTEVAGTLPAELVEWPSGADILVTSDLVVPVGGTLWIGPSARIRLAHKVSLRIEGNLDVAATSDAPVHFLADSDDDDGGWGEIGVTGAAIIRNAWFTGAGSDDSRAFGHSGSQPVIRAGEGAFVEMIGGGIVDCPGKAFASQKATVILDGLMIARVDQGGEHKASKVEVRRSHFMHIPDDDGRPEDDDNDGIYLSDTEGTGPECLVQDCVFFQGEDDAIDHNGARVIIDRVFIRQFAHEGVAASKGRDVSIIDSVIMNCDQGIEAGYEGPKVHVRNCLLTGNGVGLRWGDSYEWQATGSIDVRDTVSVGNFRHNVLFEDDQQGPAPEGTATVACSMVDDTVFDGEDGNLPGIPLWNASGCVIDGVSGRPEGCGPLGPQLCDEPPPVIPVSVSVDSSDWKWLHANPESEKEFTVSMSVAGVSFSGVVMQVHGGFARTVPKLSFRFEIPDAQATELDLFGDGAEKQRRFVLKAGWIDGTWVREYLAMDLIRRGGGLAPRVSFAELTVNGEWRGLYLLVERVDKLFLKRQAMESENVCLLKAENHNANWRDKENPMDGFDLQMGDDECVSPIGAMLEACTHTATTAGAFASGVEPLLSLHDYMVFEYVRTFTGDRDAFTKNYYLHFGRSGEDWSRARIVNWDGDAVFGNNWDGQPISPDNQSWYGWDGFATRVVSVPELRSWYLNRFMDSLVTGFNPTVLTGRADRVGRMLRDTIVRDLKYWERDLDFDEEMQRLHDAIVVRFSTMKSVIGYQLRQ